MFHYSAMTPADLDAVAAAERRLHPFPWTRGNFSDSLVAGHGAWLARENGQMTGYALVMIAVNEAHLLNISVLPEFQRGGRGSALLGHLLDQARKDGATRMLLEVRAGNAPALGLYQRHGFAEIGRRRDYYSSHGTQEDAVVMARDL